VCFYNVLAWSETTPSLFVGGYSDFLDGSPKAAGHLLDSDKNNSWMLTPLVAQHILSGGYGEQLNLLNEHDLARLKNTEKLKEKQLEYGEFNKISFVKLNVIIHDVVDDGNHKTLWLYSSLSWISVASKLLFGELVPYVDRSEIRGSQYACMRLELSEKLKESMLKECYQKAFSLNLEKLMQHVLMYESVILEEDDRLSVMVGNVSVPNNIGSNKYNMLSSFLDISKKYSSINKVESLELVRNIITQHMESILVEKVQQDPVLSKHIRVIPSPVHLNFLRDKWSGFISYLEQYGNHQFSVDNLPVLKRVVPYCDIDLYAESTSGLWLTSNLVMLKKYHVGADAVKSVDGVASAMLGWLEFPVDDVQRYIMTENPKEDVDSGKRIGKGIHEMEFVDSEPYIGRYAMIDALMASVEDLVDKNIIVLSSNSGGYEEAVTCI